MPPRLEGVHFFERKVFHGSLNFSELGHGHILEVRSRFGKLQFQGRIAIILILVTKRCRSINIVECGHGSFLSDHWILRFERGVEDEADEDDGAGDDRGGALLPCSRGNVKRCRASDNVA